MAFTTITGASGAPTTYTGTDGVDLITLVNPGASDLRAEAGNDFIGLNLTSSATNQSLRGGPGNDTFQMTGGSAALITSFIAGNLGDDQMFTTGVGVNATASTVQGGQGNDTISVSATNGGSVINGNLGNDTLNIAATGGVISSSSIFGGQGNDTINIGGASPIPAVTLAGVSIDGALGNDTIVINSLGTTGGVQGNVNVTTISGGAGEDLINATNAINFTGRLVLSGGDDNDIILGSASADNIDGGSGQDFLQGGGGQDTIAGGAGNDVFNYVNITDSANGTTMLGTLSSGRFVGIATAISSANNASISAVGVDIITSFTVGDQLRFAGVEGTSNADTALSNYTGVDPDATASDLELLGIANTTNFITDNSFSVIRGTWSASTQLFTASTLGSDTWIGVDLDSVVVASTSTSIMGQAAIIQGVRVNSLVASVDSTGAIVLAYTS